MEQIVNRTYNPFHRLCSPLSGRLCLNLVQSTATRTRDLFPITARSFPPSFFVRILSLETGNRHRIRHGRTVRLPDPSLDTRRFVDAHRRQLLTQARLLKRVPAWYLGPLSLGALGLLADEVIRAQAAGKSLWIVLLVGLAVVGVFVAVGIVNVRKAATLQARAETIDIG
ncbi:MAG: hypothetical protein R6V85_17030 [Polyangia bacterium]